MFYLQNVWPNIVQTYRNRPQKEVFKQVRTGNWNQTVCNWLHKTLRNTSRQYFWTSTFYLLVYYVIFCEYIELRNSPLGVIEEQVIFTTRIESIQSNHRHPQNSEIFRQLLRTWQCSLPSRIHTSPTEHFFIIWSSLQNNHLPRLRHGLRVHMARQMLTRSYPLRGKLKKKFKD